MNLDESLPLEFGSFHEMPPNMSKEEMLSAVEESVETPLVPRHENLDEEMEPPGW
jgi:hypothetical protein